MRFYRFPTGYLKKKRKKVINKVIIIIRDRQSITAPLTGQVIMAIFFCFSTFKIQTLRRTVEFMRVNFENCYNCVSLKTRMPEGAG